MPNSHLTDLASSPHQLFQLLRKAIKVNDDDAVRQHVDTLVHMLKDTQTLATSAVMELIDVAIRHQCCPNIKKALTRLPGFDANALIQPGIDESTARHIVGHSRSAG